MAQAAITVEVEHHHYVHLDEDVKHYLRHLVRPLLAGINRLEHNMATVAEIIAAEDVKVSTLASAFADFAADVRAYITNHPPTSGDVSDADQTAADALATKTDAVIDALAGLDTEVGDADGSDTPVPDPIPTPDPADPSV